MLRLLTLIVVGASALSLLPRPMQSAAALPPARVALTRVLVISLDGMRADALRMTAPPHIMGLAARGAVTWEAETVLPAVTLPAHASMLTGLDVSEHGLAHNDNPYTCTPISEPTFLTRAQEVGYRTATVSGKEKFCLFDQLETMDYTFARRGDASVADRAIELFQQDYQVVFAHFPNPDYFGHLTGWMSQPYVDNVYSTDLQIGRVLTAIDALGATDDTLVLLTSDHGGHDFGHGADIPEDRDIPWIIAGPGVVPGADLGDSVSVADTAATVLWALGLPVPASDLGTPRLEAFGLTDDETDG